jgi:peptidyl-prolyl cis-trans isomerase SurA
MSPIHPTPRATTSHPQRAWGGTLSRSLIGLSIMAAAASFVSPAWAQGAARSGDWITAIVNSDAVTAGEVERRVERLRLEAERAGQRVDVDALRQQVLDALIDERAIITTAREFGMRIDEADVDRAVQSVASQNQVTVDQLRVLLREQAIDYPRFREQLRDQLTLERMREREVYQRIQVSDEEIAAFLDEQRAQAGADVSVNVAQILVTVPEGADAATVAERRARIDAAAARVRAGEPFEAVAREVSDDGNRERGGEIGQRPVSRLPELFIPVVRDLQAGQVATEVLRSGAGFHLLKMIERGEPATFVEVQTRARHILIRTSPQLPAQVAAQRLAEYQRQIERGASFAELARQHSEDGSAANGGELGWASPGMFVPEFEEAMNRLPPGGISPPVATRFGVHLIQVMERREVPVEPRQLREQARNILRERKFEQAYEEWTQDLRARSYVEMREPPQ